MEVTVAPAWEMFFCQLARQPIEEALKKLLLRCLQRGWHCLVVIPDQAQLGFIDEELWSVPHEWILPHGTHNSAYHDKLPVYLAPKLTAANNPQVIFLCHGAWVHWQEWISAGLSHIAPNLQRVCLMLEAAQPHEHTQSARQLWQAHPSESRQHIKL